MKLINLMNTTLRCHDAIITLRDISKPVIINIDDYVVKCTSAINPAISKKYPDMCGSHRITILRGDKFVTAKLW